MHEQKEAAQKEVTCTHIAAYPSTPLTHHHYLVAAVCRWSLERA